MSVPLEKLFKKNNGAPSRTRGGRWRAHQCRACFVPGPPWILPKPYAKPSGSQSCYKLRFEEHEEGEGKGPRGSRRRGAATNSEGDLRPRRARSPMAMGRTHQQNTPRSGWELGRQHPPPTGAMVCSSPRTRASARARVPPAVPARIRLQNLPSAERTNYTSTRSGHSQCKASSFPPQVPRGDPDTLEQHEG